MTDPTSPVTGGVDTHKDTHVAAVLNPLGVVGRLRVPRHTRRLSTDAGLDARLR